MAHPLVLGLFDDAAAAAAAARAMRALGVAQQRVSIVARTHDEEGALADAAGASPGSELEDSRPASRLGELSAHFFAAVALALPGVGPIVADGPLAAGLGEAAGHLAGGLSRTLERVGLSESSAADWERRVDGGAIIVGAHVTDAEVDAARAALVSNGAAEVVAGTWEDS